MCIFNTARPLPTLQMLQYHAPLRDMRFVMEQVIDAPAEWARCPGFEQVDCDTVFQILEEAARFAADVLLPLNAPADREGCHRGADGAVRTPAGFRQAYALFVAGGWPALAASPVWGGQGLPVLVDAALREMLSACNHAWTMYPDLLHGACDALEAHADARLKDVYLPKIVSGEWLAAMALTEPQAGSDLGLLRTTAAPQPDGSLRVTGTKIFISGGAHDLTDNIVHLVLCRLPGAPAGTKGLSLTLVPKILPDGTRNAMHCDGIERKMGLHGSATCAMRYDGAVGWLVGAANAGLAAMFVMMNAARLFVGLQGLGHMEMALQNALRHAGERLQGRAHRRPPAATPPGAAADPIAWHPAMRQALMRMKAITEGSRVLAYRAAQAIDAARHLGDEAGRARAAGVAALLTPVVKAFLTRQGFEAASAALQVHGGYGYTEDYGIEQTLRDARITMVYEGTNEIQAIDLVVRKVLPDGEAFESVLADIGAEAERCAGLAPLRALAAEVSSHCAIARHATQMLRMRSAGDREAPHVAADDFLFGFAHLLLAWAWLAGARAATAGADAAWAAQKLATARFGIDWLLPEARPRWDRVMNPELELPDPPIPMP